MSKMSDLSVPYVTKLVIEFNNNIDMHGINKNDFNEVHGIQTIVLFSTEIESFWIWGKYLSRK